MRWPGERVAKATKRRWGRALHHDRSGGGITGRFLTNLRVENVNLCVDLGLAASGDPADAAGLAFWVSNVDDFDAFLLNSHGRFAVLQHMGKQWLTLLPWSQIPSLAAGLTGPVPLMVNLDGNVASFCAEGVKLGSAQGTPPAEGSYLGLISMASKNGAVAGHWPRGERANYCFKCDSGGAEVAPVASRSRSKSGA